MKSTQRNYDRKTIDVNKVPVQNLLGTAFSLKWPAPVLQMTFSQEEKSRLEVDVSALEEELETLAAASRTLTACTVLPLIVLIIAIVTAFLPLVSQLFGTRDF